VESASGVNRVEVPESAIKVKRSSSRRSSTLCARTRTRASFPIGIIHAGNVTAPHQYLTGYSSDFLGEHDGPQQFVSSCSRELIAVPARYQDGRRCKKLYRANGDDRSGSTLRS